MRDLPSGVLGQTSPVYSYLAQEISTVGSSSTPNTSPSQERKRPNSADLKSVIQRYLCTAFHPVLDYTMTIMLNFELCIK